MKSFLTKYLCSIVLFAALTCTVFAKPDSTTSLTTNGNANDNRVKVFINCATWGCFEDYLKTELTFFDFVRDRFQADVQLLIIRQQSANGGSQYTIDFIGQKEFIGMGDTLKMFTKQADTDDMIRNQLLRVIKLGLIRFAARSPLAEQVSVSFQQRAQSALTQQADSWDAWIFNVGMWGNFEGESNRFFLWMNSFASAKRITADSKIIVSGFYRRNTNQYTIDGEEKSATTQGYGANGLYAKSLSEHWSIGLTYMGEHSVFRNIHFSHRVAPALEYNIFPFSENTRRQLRFVYELGYQHFTYIDSTIFDHITEARPYHRASVLTEITQPWGSINAVLQGYTFLDNFAQNRLQLRGEINLRIVEGLSIQAWGAASLVNDQISLSKAVANNDAVLLGGRQLPTTFSYFSGIGINYTFGSIFNTVVNPRLGQLDMN